MTREFLLRARSVHTLSDWITTSAMFCDRLGAYFGGLKFRYRPTHLREFSLPTYMGRVDCGFGRDKNRAYLSIAEQSRGGERGGLASC